MCISFPSHDRGAFGFLGDGTGNGDDTLDTHFDSASKYTYNIQIGGSSGAYTGKNSNNQFPANTAAVGFTDHAGGDYSLAPSSDYKNDASDGTDPGVIWATLQAKGLV